MNFLSSLHAATASLLTSLDATEVILDGAQDFGITLFVIISILLIFTIAFELIKIAALSATTKYTQPIVVTLFSEMTVLGFLSIVAYAVDHSGLSAAISIAVFGDSAEDFLTETLETIHYLLFLVMILTIFQVIMLTHISEVAMTNFTSLNLISQNIEDVTPFIEKLDDMPNLTFRDWFWNYLSMGPVTAWKYHQELQEIDSTLVFYSIRKEFIGCRSALPNYLLASKSKRLPANFDFARYLSIALSNYFVKIISFTPDTWLMLWFVGLVVYAIAVAVNGDVLIMAIIWLILGYFDLLVIYGLNLKVTNIVEHLLNPSHFQLIDKSEQSKYAERTPSPSVIENETGDSDTKKKARRGSHHHHHSPRHHSHHHHGHHGHQPHHQDPSAHSPGNYDNNNASLSKDLNVDDIERDAEAGESTSLLHRAARSGSVGARSQVSAHSQSSYAQHLKETEDHSSVVIRVRQHMLRTPLWTAIKPSEQGWLSYYILGKHVPNKHEMLFWGDKHGPALNLFILRIHLFVQSIYFSLLVCYYIPAIFIEHEYYWGIVYLIVSMIPFPILIVSIYGPLLINMTISASSGLLREKSIIVEIIRQQKLEKVVRLLVMLTRLQESARLASEGHTLKRKAYDRDDPKIKAEIGEISRIFDQYDTDGEDGVSLEELTEMFKQFGMNLKESDMQAIFNVLDVDKDGTVSKQELIDWKLSHTTSYKESDYKNIAREIFMLFDEDGSGEITVEEFVTALNRFDSGLTETEMLEVARDLDESGDGTLSLEEFERAITQAIKQM